MVKHIHQPEANQEKAVPKTELLNIDFDLYTDGDQEFKVELIELMINNLKELQWALGMNLEVFKKVCHKIKSTIAILSCKTLNEVIEDLSSADTTDRWRKTNVVKELCDDIIKSLEAESN
ncbi:MAG: hypothetical protein ABI663_17230 [Chryseolinea sp.]